MDSGVPKASRGRGGSTLPFRTRDLRVYLRVCEAKAMPSYLIRDFQHSRQELVRLLSAKRTETGILDWDDKAEFHFGQLEMLTGTPWSEHVSQMTRAEIVRAEVDDGGAVQFKESQFFVAAPNAGDAARPQQPRPP